MSVAGANGGAREQVRVRCGSPGVQHPALLAQGVPRTSAQTLGAHAREAAGARPSNGCHAAVMQPPRLRGAWCLSVAAVVRRWRRGARQAGLAAARARPVRWWRQLDDAAPSAHSRARGVEGGGAAGTHLGDGERAADGARLLVAERHRAVLVAGGGLAELGLGGRVKHGQHARDVLAHDADLGELGGGAAGHLRDAKLGELLLELLKLLEEVTLAHSAELVGLDLGYGELLQGARSGGEWKESGVKRRRGGALYLLSGLCSTNRTSPLSSKKTDCSKFPGLFTRALLRCS